MKLYYSVTSPYSRKVYVLARKLGLAEKIELIVGSSMDPETDLPNTNPLGKVPALITDAGAAVFDSPVIVETLNDMAGVKRGDDYLAQLQLQAVADGIMDAAVAMAMETRRPDAEPSAFWMDRWTQAILRAVKYLEDQGTDGLEGWHMGSIATVCALDYVGFRHEGLNWRAEAPALAAWFDTAKGDADITATDPRTNS
ncbi:glutathione S-transferase N-terminal domain-containing protein [Kordiimonas marina]|uniref:glutathione S-transferase N-terminal domain-containing protein n=1 Tax=Kordiimonas marina TaxID=2872312 RepID=UPI001FF21488|nr:glutathione S-transferase N-terminal domain-containing protein [Kordiimonas marina]MCJ9428093.1 glutathione S-transferase N-terminal domain-containing protein [Kordiimonas marina]